jgi:adhesin/invasin
LTIGLVSLEPGEYPVGVKLGSETISPQSRSLEFVVGPISAAPGDSTLRLAPANAVADESEEVTATVELRDAGGNAIPDGIVLFEVPEGVSAVTAEGLKPGPAQVEAPAPGGTASLAYVSGRAGTYAVSAAAKRAGEASWVQLTDGAPADLVFVFGEVSAAGSLIDRSAAGPLTADGASAYTVTVTLRDEHGNAHQAAGVPVRFEFSLGATSVTRDVESGPDGVASVEFATEAAGQWTVTALVAGETVAGGSLALPFQAGNPVVANSGLEVTQGEALAGVAGAHAAWVVVRDQHGNPVPEVDVTFALSGGTSGVDGPFLDGARGAVTVTSCDPALADAPAWCDQVGKAQVLVTAMEANDFEVSATMAGQTLPGSPASVRFVIGTISLGHSAVEVDPVATANDTVSVPAGGAPGDSFEVSATIRSDQQLLVAGAQVRLTGLAPWVVVSPAPAVVTGDQTSGAWGVARWSLTSLAAGESQGRVQVLTEEGWRDVGDPFLVRFGPGGVSGQHSELTSPSAQGGATVVASGSHSHRVEVRVKDGFDNQVAGAEVLFAWSHPGGSGTVSGTEPVTADSDGVAYWEFASPDPVTWTVTATVSGQDVSGGPVTAAFASGRPVGALSWLTSDPLPSPGGGQGTQTVQATLVDAAGGTPSCGVAAVETACVVDFLIPEGTWFGDGAGRVGGPASVPVEASAGIASLTLRGQEGSWPVSASVSAQPITTADGVTDPSGGAQPAHVRFSDVTAPEGLALQPSDGAVLRGAGEAGDLVSAVDGSGAERCSAEVAADGSWSCQLAPPAQEGDLLRVIESDASGNTTEVTWRVGLPRVSLAAAQVRRGETLTVAGANLQPAEAFWVLAAGVQVASGVTDSQGALSASWTVPLGAPVGAITIELTGELSGSVTTQGTVAPQDDGGDDGVVTPPQPGGGGDPNGKGKLPVTGSDGLVGMLGLAAGLLAAGAFLVRRRRGA